MLVMAYPKEQTQKHPPTIHSFHLKQQNTAAFTPSGPHCRDVPSCAGADQACAMASLVYFSTIAGPMHGAFEAISALDAGARIFLFSDDIQPWILPAHMATAILHPH